MTKDEQRIADRELMAQAASEIRQLRRINEVLSAKVEVMDFFAVVLNTKPAYQNVGASEDVAWLLDRRMAEIETARLRDAE